MQGTLLPFEFVSFALDGRLVVQFFETFSQIGSFRSDKFIFLMGFIAPFVGVASLHMESFELFDDWGQLR